jgi:hypothetical protein
VANRCDTCKHWEHPAEDDYYYNDVGLRECLRAKPFWECSEYDETDGTWQRKLTPEHVNDMMFCQDGSDYRAVLLTKPEFFCAHWEAKGGQ